jgi:hypothetical protein
MIANQIAGLLFDGAPPAPSAAFESIATVNVGAGGTGTVTFSSIPSTYKHLQVRFTCRGNDTAADRALYMQLNSDTGTNYAWHRIRGDGSTATAGAGTSLNYIFVGSLVDGGTASNIFGAGVVDLLDYTNTNKYKTARITSGFDKNGATGYINYNSGLWQNTAAVNSISLFYQGSVNTVQYSSFALYGIK